MLSNSSAGANAESHISDTKSSPKTAMRGHSFFGTLLVSQATDDICNICGHTDLIAVEQTEV